jgi:hypothetical protein
MSGRAIAQAVSRWLPTAAARVRARVWSSGICGGQSGGGAGFLRVLRFPLPIFILPNSPSSSITRGRYNRPFSGRCAEWTQLGLHRSLCELKKNSSISVNMETTWSTSCMKVKIRRLLIAILSVLFSYKTLCL